VERRRKNKFGCLLKVSLGENELSWWLSPYIVPF
jgi:hypothetical protein